MSDSFSDGDVVEAVVAFDDVIDDDANAEAFVEAEAEVDDFGLS